MKKEFIPYEQALALKELGFDEPCLSSFDENKNLFKVWENDMVNGRTICLAPLYQQAFRWFREKHDLQTSNIMFSNGKYDSGITKYKGTQSVWGHGPIYDTYEEAELVCLNKLIELIKTK